MTRCAVSGAIVLALAGCGGDSQRTAQPQGGVAASATSGSQDGELPLIRRWPDGTIESKCTLLNGVRYKTEQYDQSGRLTGAGELGEFYFKSWTEYYPSGEVRSKTVYEGIHRSDFGTEATGVKYCYARDGELTSTRRLRFSPDHNHTFIEIGG